MKAKNFYFFFFATLKKGDTMKTLEEIMAEVKEAIKGNEGFRMDSIFPFYLHARRINITQIELVDHYCGTDLEKIVRENGNQIDINSSLWTL